MAFDPDARERRMGAHVFTVEGLDLSAHGYPGLTFDGDLDIGVDNDAPEWIIEAAHAPDPTDSHRAARTYRPDDGAIGAAIVEAVLQDARWCELITDACWYHGEG